MLEKHNNHIELGRVRIEALNRPDGWSIFEGPQELAINRIKVASVEKDNDLGGFDISAAVKDHPEHLFVKVFAIKKDEVNDNGDSFSEAELKKAAPTFVGVPLFCNHANDDIEKARGQVVHAWYDDTKGGIYIVSRVDKIAYPKLARGIEEGYISGTSMGCQVHHSNCSICHNKAHVADEYCSHVRNQKTKKFSGKVKCAYHKSKCKPEDDCPECGCKKGEEKEHDHKEAKVYEHNKGLKFIEDSFVVNPACHDCLVDCVLNVPEYQKKVANLRPKLEKLVAAQNSNKVTKVAGQTELELLNKAMKYMEVVAKSMMDQKESVSMDYVSDIVDVLASTQTVTDELIEMGYGTLQSPVTLQNPENVGDAVNINGQQGEQTSPNAMQPGAAEQAAPQPSGASTSPAGGIGNVTKPTFSPTASGNLKEMTKEGSNLYNSILEIREILSKHQNEIEAVSSNNQVKESEIMENNTKTAAGEALKKEFHQKTIEKQLNDAKLDYAGNRQYKDISETTDQQLGGKEQVNDTTTDSPQVRKGEYADYTTELQLDKDMKDSEIVRWDSAPNVILEKQWESFHHTASDLDHDQSITGQLDDLRKNHRWNEPAKTIELQLQDDENWLSKDNAWLDKRASAAYARALVKSAMEAISDAIAIYKRTPSEIAKAASFITKDPQSQIKAAFLTLVNGMPSKVASRKEEKARAQYFDKIAGTVQPYKTVDALLACMGDHCSNLKAEDFVDAVRHVASNATKMASVQEMAQIKLSKKSEEFETTVDKFAAFDEAFESVTNKSSKVASENDEDDGIYQVRATVDEIGVDINNQNEFVAATDRFAQSQVNRPNLVLAGVEVDDSNETVIATLKEVTKLTAEEAVNAERYASSLRSSKRNSMVREAQMMGGDMGGMGGGAPGGAPPGAPPAVGPPGAPPAPPAETMDAPPGEEGDAEGEGGEQPKPPLSICPLCGSEDVDVVSGKGKCNNPDCGAEFVGKFQLEITKGKGISNDTDSGDEDGNGDAPLGGDEGTQEGEGFAMPDSASAGPSMPVAAMMKLTPGRLEKLASKSDWSVGVVSPLTGSKNTVHIAKGTDAQGFPFDSYLCMDTGANYSVHTRIDNKDKKVAWTEWRWLPKVANSECGSCNRAKNLWTKALKANGLNDEQFDSMNFKQKADTILAMKEAGHFAVIKTASKNVSVVNEFQKAVKVAGSFPITACRQKLANRYGENALAISGPCKGENLADCVCNELKKASVYTDGLAVKVAEAWKDKDACIECMEDYVRLGYDMEKSATVCQHLKLKYATAGEMFAEEMGDMNPQGPQGPGGGGRGMPQQPGQQGQPGLGNGGMGGDELDTTEPFAEQGIDLLEPPAEDINVNPMGDGQGVELELTDMPGLPGADDGQGGSSHGSVTIELPLSALDAIEQAIDSAHGGANSADIGGDLNGADLGDDLGDNGEVEISMGDETPADDNGDSSDGSDDSSDDMGFGNGDESDNDDSSNNFEGSNDDSSEDNKDKHKEPEVADNTEFKESDESEKLASYMRRGKISGNREINLDVASILSAMNKKAGEVEPKVEPAQDATEVTYQAGDGSVQGSEEKFDADNPKVPRNKALIGGEDSDLNPQDKPLPKVPKANGREGNLEGEENYEAESGVNMSGGMTGAGGAQDVAENTTKASAKKNVKVANEKKIDKAKPVSEEIEIDFSNNKDHSKSSIPRKPFEESDSKEIKNIPQRGEGSFLGDEKNSIDYVPTAPERQPTIPMNGERMSKEKNERYSPEKQDKIKGTVIANDEKSQAVLAEATRIAGRMLEEKMITASGLMTKIRELGSYQVTQLKDIEVALFKKTAQKGLATEPGGVEQPAPVISQASNERSHSLVKDVESLFKLTAQNNIASELTDANVRDAFGKR